MSAAKAKKRPAEEPGDRCLDCDWCRETARFERGPGYICVKLHRKLTRRRLWGKPCRHFVPLVPAP